MTESYLVSRSIDAPIDRIFGILADPARHRELDASDMLGESDSAVLGAVGQTFTVLMYRADLGRYRTLNTVTEFVRDEALTWAPRLDTSYECPLVDRLSTMRTGGHTYSYRLVPRGTRTEVTQIYDWSSVQDPQFAAFCPLIGLEQLAGTLANLDRVATSSRPMP
ncbi:hypothetical protein [Pseudonocardia alni]|uniref:hypothetical protein n=1 Tax=Pseudonocardia alni TaxID=33907 RepID=UPI0033D9A909